MLRRPLLRAVVCSSVRSPGQSLAAACRLSKPTDTRKSQAQPLEEKCNISEKPMREIRKSGQLAED